MHMPALQCGFTYTIETIVGGQVVDREVVHNLVPTEGLNHILGVTLKGTTPVTTWYTGIYEGNYTPALTDTMAAFPAAATESTAYDEAVRQTMVFGTVSGGTVDNSASVAVFSINAPKTIYGAFISSSSVKGAVTGPLLSAVRFTTPKVLDAGAQLKVTGGFVLTSS